MAVREKKNGSGGEAKVSAKRRGSRSTKKRRHSEDLEEIELTAATADKHMLYEEAVQSVDFEIETLEKIFKSKRHRLFRSLREDFCGTANLACEWVKRGEYNTAIGLDLDQETLDWGIKHHVSRLGDDADRVVLQCKDVRSVTEPKVDLVVAFNYSYSVFKKRDELREYFRLVKESLKDDGVFFLDAYGGTDATIELEEDREVEESELPDGRELPAFTYVWEQVRFNPVNHEILCKIHFDFEDGTRMKNAFTYNWRYWTLPEIREIMEEAGFKETEVYVEGWDDEEDEADGIFSKTNTIEEMAGWVGYIVGLK